MAAPAVGGARLAFERRPQQLDNLIDDNGPHSLTRPVARRRLLQATRGELAGRQRAIDVLAAMKEVGPLMARDDGPQGTLATAALSDLLER